MEHLEIILFLHVGAHTISLLTLPQITLHILQLEIFQPLARLLALMLGS